VAAIVRFSARFGLAGTLTTVVRFAAAQVIEALAAIVRQPGGP
jgi:hypothetical protein